MRTLSLAVSIALTLAACGGDSTPRTNIDAPTGGGNEAGGGNLEAGVLVDSGTAAAMGLGKVCSQTVACPTTGATMCIRLSQTATTGFCTLPCGSTTAPPAGTNPTPPPGGDMVCTASMPAPGSGTPKCVLSTAPANNMISWDCGILCGMSGTTNLGMCPTGLTCTQNVCQ